MIADAKAMQYVLPTSGYRFPKPHTMRAVARQILGDGIVVVEGGFTSYIHDAYSFMTRAHT